MRAAILILLTVTAGFAHPPILIPQIADGGGWKSTVVVLNSFSVHPAQVSILFRNSDGSKLTLPLEKFGTLASLEIELPAQGSIFLETTGTSQNVQVGWVEINQPTGAVAVKAFALFRQSVPGRPDYEAMAPGLRMTDATTFPFDNTKGFATSFAAVNLATSDCTLAATAIYDESGNPLITEPRLIAALPSRGHSAFLSTDKVPEMANKRGYVSFDVTTLACAPGSMAMMALRFNPTGPFTNLLPLSAPPLF